MLGRNRHSIDLQRTNRRGMPRCFDAMISERTQLPVDQRQPIWPTWPLLNDHDRYAKDR